MSWQYKMVKKFQLHSKGVVVSGLTDLGWVLITCIRQLLTTEATCRNNSAPLGIPPNKNYLHVLMQRRHTWYNCLNA